MKKLLLMFVGISLGFIALAQKSVSLCESYDEDGNAKGLYDSWDISPTGGFVYIVYKQDKTIKGKLQLQIDKKVESTGKYKAYATLDLVPDKGNNWAMYDYKFTEAGKYQVKVVSGSNELASATTEIFVKEAGEKTVDNANADDSDIDTYYYENSEILFGTGVTTEGKLEGKDTEFKLGSNESIELAVYISNDDRLATKKLYITIYDDQDAVYDDFDISIEPDWDWVKFKQTFTEKGDFTIDIYNENDIYVNSATVTIK